MKAIIFATLACTFQLAEARATMTPTAILIGIKQERTPVELSDLPDAIKKTLKGEEYAGWIAKNAFYVSDGDGHYEIELQKGKELQIVKFDKDGKKLDSRNMDH
jgi:hypothetical protein